MVRLMRSALSARRTKVIRLIAKGCTLEDIAADLKVSTRTIDIDLKSIDA